MSANVSPKDVKASKMEITTTRSWTAKPVLDSDFTDALPLQEVYVGILRQRKDISSAIQSIATIMPGFGHLKRCSNGKLLLAPFGPLDKSIEVKDLFSEDQLRDELNKKGFDLSLLEDKFQVMKVPAKIPRTKSQASVASKIWPVNFHPDPTIESLIDGSIFNEVHLDAFEKIMSLVIKAAKLEATGDERCTGAAAIVDPADGRILAVSAARTNQHPMWHAAMLAVDLIARLHGGGAWQLDNDNFAANVGAGTIDKERASSEEKRGFHDTADEQRRRLKRIKRRYKEDTPLCFPRSLSTLPFPIQTPLEMPIQGQRTNNGSKPSISSKNTNTEECIDNTAKCGPYLCTGYWVFLLMEPCPLCAMALLHSRVTRIFYGTANQNAGVLGSRAVLHTVQGLNHRYRVWSGILEEECRQTVEEINVRNRCN